jgi:hypothetical protein
MSKKTIVATVDSQGNINSNEAMNPYDIAAGISVITADYATFASDLATLVADGAAPTQGHVNSVNSDWTTLKGILDGLVASAAAAATAFNVGAVVQIDSTLIPATTPLDAPRLLSRARG